MITDELKAERLISLARARRLKGAALESKALRDLQEARLLKFIAEQGSQLGDLDNQAAADLAKATRDTLFAAERLAVARVMEAEERLEVLKEAAEVAHARVLEADKQNIDILSTLDGRSFDVAPAPNLVADFPDPLPFWIPLSHQSKPLEEVGIDAWTDEEGDSDGDEGDASESDDEGLGDEEEAIPGSDLSWSSALLCPPQSA